MAEVILLDTQVNRYVVGMITNDALDGGPNGLRRSQGIAENQRVDAVQCIFVFLTREELCIFVVQKGQVVVFELRQAGEHVLRPVVRAMIRGDAREGGEVGVPVHHIKQAGEVHALVGARVFKKDQRRRQ